MSVIGSVSPPVPCGGGLITVISSSPVSFISDAGIVALSSVLLSNSVVRSAPFTRTTELDTKFVPVNVSSNSASPAYFVFGKISVRVTSLGLLTRNALLAPVISGLS
ncbi:MAG: hypothetical protein WD381_07765, partial [Balneolaceae bacterium]